MTADLSGRVALVTGASGGLGASVARGLAAAGAAVALADLPSDSLTALESELGDPAAAFSVDLADPSAAQALPQHIATRFGHLDILVNNAGVRAVHPLTEHPLRDWQRTLDINLTAPYLLIQASATLLEQSGHGAIVNTTSTAAELAFGNRAAYNVSKAGLAMLTKSAALELGPLGVRCNAVAPGIIETPLNSHYFQDPQFSELIVSNTPVRGWGRPDDVAGPVAFLCSDDARFINGTTVLVDGGWSTGKGY